MIPLRIASLVAALTLPLVSATGQEDVVASQLPTYPLTTCVVSGEVLGDMGAPVEHVHEGRLVRLCCESCSEEFAAAPATYLARIDQAVIAAQLPAYPVTSCLVSDEPLDEDSVNVVVGTRLLRLCCLMCRREFAEDPAAVLARLDAAYIAAQLPTYALTTCVVTGEALDDGAQDMLYGNRLVRLCCKGCKREFAKAPPSFLAKLDKAAAAGDGARHGDGNGDGHGDGNADGNADGNGAADDGGDGEGSGHR